MSFSSASSKPEVTLTELAVCVDDSSDNEKGVSFQYIEEARASGLSQEDALFYAKFTPEQRKTCLRKIDVRLVPMLSILYLIAHLDRANIGNAKIEGLAEDLHMVGDQWNIVLSLFFIPYILFEIPSNMVLKKFKRPSVYIGILVTSWGIIMTLHGVVRNFGSLLALRLLLGALEAGFFPGAAYLCTAWYMPDVLASRISWFYWTSATSGAFSGLLAAGIAKMRGIGGYEGWRWIFIIEGMMTIMLGVLCFFFLVDYPWLSGKWLTADEMRFLSLQQELKQGNGSGRKIVDDRSNWEIIKGLALNWRLHMQSFILVAMSVSSYGMKFALPTIIKGMGFQNTAAQLMTAPVFMSGAITGVVLARLSDRFKRRMPFIALAFTLISIGYSVVMSFTGSFHGPRLGAAYFSLMLAAMGTYSVFPIACSWAANNMATEKQRAFGLALNAATGALGGVVGSFMYMDKEKPTYFTGYSLVIAFGVAALATCFLVEYCFVSENRRRDKIPEEVTRAKYTDEELLKMDDKNPLFRYTL